MTFIRPIEFNGHVQRTNEVSGMKQQEDSKPLQDQSNGQQTVQKHVEHRMHEVAGKDNADQHQKKYDAKEKGSNEYSRQQQKKRKKQPEEKVVKKSTHGFDIKI